MIDVVFLLLIFFMVTSSFVQVSGITVKLPEAASGKAFRDKAECTVVIDADGNYFIDKKLVSRSELAVAFEQIRRNIPLIISADKNVGFNFVMHVWDLAREKKFKEIVVLTKPEK